MELVLSQLLVFLEPVVSLLLLFRFYFFIQIIYFSI